MDMLKDLLKKKAGSGKEMDPKYKNAKMGVLKQISDMASEAMGNGIKGIKKVEVAADSEEGLQKGLEKASDMVEGEEPSEDEGAVLSEHGGGHPAELSEEVDEAEGMSSDQIDQLIKQLEAKKAKLQ